MEDRKYVRVNCKIFENSSEKFVFELEENISYRSKWLSLKAIFNGVVGGLIVALLLSLLNIALVSWVPEADAVDHIFDQALIILL
ncbi:hypothetical protein [Martelella sp.]|uniref:hypothetical protein n=1 Tax=Martelella sp. TaxID=1969699 RepID=UPI0025BB1BA8|nr:hypothetical protein [Martelella sp.]|tara:strand:- start:278 stop:532 length:255 start_codon:yes stop_codon:yes gene_type:complete